MKIKLDIPVVCFLLIVMHQFWSLWAEAPVSELLYQVSTILLFLFWILTRPSLIQKAEDFFRDIAFFIWAFLMFFAYQFEHRFKSVSWLGMEIDSHARIIIYFSLLILPCMYLFKNKKLYCTKKFKIFMAVIAGSNLFYSLRAVAIFPDALRARGTMEYMGLEEFLFATPSFSVIHALVLLLPWFLAKAKESIKKEKLFYSCIFIALLVTVAVSQFATALLAALVSVFIYWTFCENNKTKRYIRLCVISSVFFCVTFFENAFMGLLHKLSSIVTGTWGVKLIEIITFVSGGGATGDLETRSSLYTTSLLTFLKSPILGMVTGKQGEIGGHSTLIDMLALVGILGTIAFIVLIFITFKNVKENCRDRNYTVALYSTVIAYVILLCTKNLISALAVNFTFFVLIPILFSMEDKNEQS